MAYTYVNRYFSEDQVSRMTMGRMRENIGPDTFIDLRSIWEYGLLSILDIPREQADFLGLREGSGLYSIYIDACVLDDRYTDVTKEAEELLYSKAVEAGIDIMLDSYFNGVPLEHIVPPEYIYTLAEAPVLNVPRQNGKHRMIYAQTLKLACWQHPETSSVLGGCCKTSSD